MRGVRWAKAKTWEEGREAADISAPGNAKQELLALVQTGFAMLFALKPWLNKRQAL